MKYLTLFLFFSISVHADFIKSDFQEYFLPTNTEEGPLSLEKIKQLEDGLNQIGHQEIINRLQEKLGITDLNGVRLHVQSCNTAPDVLGTYSRGETRRYKKSLSSQSNPNNLELFWGSDESILDMINKAFRVFDDNNPAYASLVLQSWPTICLRPGLSFADTISVFAHEVEHFIGDDYTEPDYLSLDVEEYVSTELISPGGEFNAYQAGARVLTSLKHQGHLTKFSSYLQFFDQNGELIDSEGLKLYILDTLKYREKFIKRYHYYILEDHKTALNNRKDLFSYLDLYTQRLESLEQNLPIYLGNKKIFESNIVLHLKNIDIVKASILAQGNYTKEDLIEYKSLLAKQREKLDIVKRKINQCKKEITYFTNLILITNSEIEKIEEAI